MRIGIYYRHSFHQAIFASTISALEGAHRCLATSDTGELTRFRPHVIVAGEDLTYLHLRAHLPFTRFVHTRHGLANKGTPARSFRAADYVCLTSDYVRDEFLAQGIRPRRAYWVTGYVQMDNLFSAGRPPQIPAGRKVVLYAPTWHDGLSSLPLLGERVVELLHGDRSDTFVAIKPHPLVQEGKDPRLAPWLDTLRRACAGRPDTYLIENRAEDIMPWLKAADVLVSDASSVQLEYLALDRPLVLIDNPEHTRSPHYDPKGLEWAWRDMGERLSDVAHLPAALATALDDPRQRHEKRALYRERLFGAQCDGRSGERLAQRIDQLESEVASEAQLLAVSPFGRAFHTCLPHLRNASRTFKRLLRSA
ncbi:CDP-glycerol--poly(glycerophosphate) glycerophosphotransferase [Opitutus terrae]|uniref:CDP-glycerol:poly(Glycerophosphate) glycerophosphotransferase n=1 Tax=Opitutus terrae (strain DSM 11246 / JCM 15787 / PB90-1) TaxID=452637 RepID=B2A094_OPITP|nr:CDP-glycerol--poly(glycerophosphate) glycerophosphotransferase [Opitutus terrae]ACB77430.1 CDP-glycerol:poly(glycerophosphate) glycerophosphotransferase [Opitutus terrae PB90-1]